MGGMTGVGTPELAAHMSAAGGLGVFAIHNAGGSTDEEMIENGRAWIRKAKVLCGDKPFGVNLTILPAARPPPYAGFVDIIVEEGVPVLETAGSGGAMLGAIVAKAKDAGIICIHKCTSVRHALSAEKYGVDILSVDGFECAGHPGRDDVGNLVLLASASKQLTVPFIASGGIATGAQLAAVIALGADGVNLGTRVCITQECMWPSEYKQRAVESTELDTVILNRKLGDPTRFAPLLAPLASLACRDHKPQAPDCIGAVRFCGRFYRNKTLVEAVAIEEDADVYDEKFFMKNVFPLVAGKRGRQAEKDGDPDAGQWSAGQSVGLINDVPTVAGLTQNFMHDAYDTFEQRLRTMLGVEVPEPAVARL
jgi:NAD(P)H-dependent flavin oxidoreductase YrpB (nitropropane dioxygenase family)